MNSLLFSIAIAAQLSLTSLLVVLFRVSPLTAPTQAIPAFFASVFLTVSSVGALAFYGLWKAIPFHSWDTGKMLSVSVRQGIFLGVIVFLILLLHILGALTWWIGLLIVMVFLLIELALHV